ncbi:hypothetical protein QOL99_08490 [Deinococcus sp. MIMF12]|uniref:Uncharacterized protein n=1 Tax=Deinococcus rhizophilus TaxID=3049544 RepID=A0ABT7JGK4_9DEIO|nr:hypothetical protein [Deinococcus rhizophilus]MDL2344189.1 hypothetical protein [Deinococcus rhizophilus]
MNDQLQQTLQALQGGVTSVDAGAAVSNISAWEQTLGGASGAGGITGQLSQLRSMLEGGDLDGAAALLPGLADATEQAASSAPAADQDGLRQLASLLRP